MLEQAGYADPRTAAEAVYDFERQGRRARMGHVDDAQPAAHLQRVSRDAACRAGTGFPRAGAARSRADFADQDAFSDLAASRRPTRRSRHSG